MTYYFSFNGRKIGAIGKVCAFRQKYSADSLSEALSKLYANYSHISFRSVKENRKTIPLETVLSTRIES